MSARFAITAAVIALALCVSRWLVRRVHPRPAAAACRRSRALCWGCADLRWRRVLPVKFLGGALALGAGLVLGREGPTIHMGGAAALGVARAARSRPGEVTALIAAGAGAGIAAAFNAPIAGVLFVVEEMRREAPYNFQGYHAVLIACVAAVFVTEAISGVGPELRLPMAAPQLAHYPLFLASASSWASLGAAFNRLVLATLACLLGVVEARRLVPGDGPVRWRRPLCCSCCPMAAVPASRSSSRWWPNRSAQALLVLLLVRLVATLASYAAGTPGGIFAPILGLATVAGLGFVEVGRSPTAGPGLEPSAFAAAAMAALFTASVRAPLVGVVLVAELTDGYPALLAITLSTAMASLTAAALGGRPLYEMLLERTLRLSRPPTKLMEPA